VIASEPHAVACGPLSANIHPWLKPLVTPPAKKPCSKLNNVLHFLELQDLCSGFSPSFCYPMVSTMLLFRNNAMLLFHDFFPAWETPSLTQQESQITQ